MKKIIFCSAILMALFILSLFPLRSQSAYAATGNGRIYGQLQDGSNNNALVSGQSVTLQTLQGGNGHDFASVTSDAQGNFSFDNLPSDKTTSYAIYLRYQGAQYISDLVTLDSNPTRQLNLTIYQATGSTTNLAVVDTTILVREPDAQKGIINVSEIIAFRNLDIHTFVGSLDASKGKPDALFFSLPANVHNISLGKGFSGYQVLQVDRGFASDAAVLPGPNEFSFSFDIPYTGTSYDLNYVPMYPTVTLSTLVPPDLQTTSSALQPEGLTTGTDQHPYRLFKATGLLANQEVHMNLAGLPALQAATIPPLSLNTSNLWLIVIVLVMLVIIGVTWFLYRSRRHKPAHKQRRKTVGTAKATHATTKAATTASKTTKATTTARAATSRAAAARADAPTRADTTKAKKIAPVHTSVASSSSGDPQNVLFQELLDLDANFETGKLAKKDYDEQRTEIKTQLRSLLSAKKIIKR